MTNRIDRFSRLLEGNTVTSAIVWDGMAIVAVRNDDIEGTPKEVCRLRKRRLWSVQKLATRAGVTARFISSLESGEEDLSTLKQAHKFAQVAKALEVSTQKLVPPTFEYEVEDGHMVCKRASSAMNRAVQTAWEASC